MNNFILVTTIFLINILLYGLIGRDAWAIYGVEAGMVAGFGFVAIIAELVIPSLLSPKTNEVMEVWLIRHEVVLARIGYFILFVIFMFWLRLILSYFIGR